MQLVLVRPLTFDDQIIEMLEVWTRLARGVQLVPVYPLNVDRYVNLHTSCNFGITNNVWIFRNQIHLTLIIE
jgi:Fe-S oxidoreductase